MSTVYAEFKRVATRRGDADFLCIEAITAAAYGIDAGARSWREVAGEVERLRGAYAQGWLAEEAVWLAMIEDRNRTSHTYREELAKEIHSRLPAYLVAVRAALAQVPTD